MCFLLGLEMLPISLVVVTFLTFITTYVISVSNGHVTPYLPYISDTGAKSPESCIFGQLLTVSTIIGLHKPSFVSNEGDDVGMGASRRI
uniref:CWH43-like N-terminal domain-containing protein n=1 Tax=Octopus bimaculoides TaxID=37653 RepID=A0A0L8FRN2_OCTBM